MLVGGEFRKHLAQVALFCTSFGLVVRSLRYAPKKRWNIEALQLGELGCFQLQKDVEVTG